MNLLHHIMLVDDEPDIREIARLCLEDLGGMQVTVCGSGQEALDKLLEIKPQLVLLDVMMPGMNGMTTLAKIRAMPEREDVPIIFMTARIQPVEMQHYLKLGAIGTIAKPFEPMALCDNIRKLWNERVG